MKREGYLIEDIIERKNLEEAFEIVMRGKKNTRSVLHFKENKELIISRISDKIELGLYTPAKHREFKIYEHNKERLIQSLSFEDRVALHAIIKVVYLRVVKKMLIRDTYSSLPGRGIHDGLRRVRKALRDKENTLYCCKLDFRKFYPSVDQNILIKLLRRKIKDQRVLVILINIIRSYRSGLPIGYHSSQLFGNFYLCILDYYAKYILKIKYYFRYCDDIVILSSSKEELWKYFEKLKEFAKDMLHLTFKNNYQVFPVEARGIDFLGYVIRHDYVLIRKHIKKRAARKLKTVKSKKRRQSVIGAYWGWAKYSNSINLTKRLLGMKDFSQLKISPSAKDGKKIFVGKQTPLGDLMNYEIVILDFETGIRTSYGEDRYVVQYEMNGEKGRFITNSGELKDLLNQIKALGELPFRTTIKREPFGNGKFKYVFS